MDYDDLRSHPFVEKIEQNLNAISSLLNPEFESTITSTFAEKIEKFGIVRTKTVDLLHSLTKLNLDILNEGMLEENVFKTLLEFLPRFPWNNFLHFKTDSIFTHIFENTNSTFKAKVLSNTELIDVLLKIH